MQKRGARVEGLGAQIQAARAFAPGLEIQQLKASVRARLFGTFEGAPTLGGYTLRRLIGHGGMGAVFEAVGRDEEAVALKVLRGFDPAALYRFKLEFRALAELAHPNLALLHHLVIRGDQAYLTMEFVDGVDFIAHVREDAARLRPALAQLVAGLEALHAAGKLHRDIKPSNVLVTREGRVVILDFGLVLELGGAGGEQLVGTPAYMAPEQVVGAPPSAASDWYAVGVMLFEALTGRLPFPGTGVDVLQDKCERDAPAPGPGADPELAALCVRLLARGPELRAGGAELAALVGAPRPALLRRSGAGLGLVGRGAASAELRAALLAGARAPVVALIRGASGMGKSALLRAFLEEAQAGAAGVPEPAVVLAGRCHEREQVPYNAFDSVVDALTGLLLGLGPRDLAAVVPADIAALGRIFPGLRRVAAIAEACAADPPAESDAARLRQAIHVLRDMLRRIAGRGPVVLAVDDAQWADGDSAALLGELLRGPDAPPCLVVLAAREAGASNEEELAVLIERIRVAEVPLREIVLSALRPEQATALAEALLRRGPAEVDGAVLCGWAAAISAESGGLPLFVRELVHHVRTDMVEGPALGPVRLGEMLAARLSRLPETARRLLEAVAVAGRPIELEVVAAAAGATAGGRRELQQLRAAHLVRASKSPRGEVVESFHERIQGVVAGFVPEERARVIHARLAELLLARPGVPPELLAGHLRGAGDRVRAAELTRLAAERAAESLALLRAAELYREAAALLPRGDEDGRRDMLTRAGEALSALARGAEAAECLLAAAAVAPALAATGLRQRAAAELLRGGAVQRGRPLVQQVLTELGEPPPAGPVARALQRLGQRIELWRRGRSFTPRPAAEIPPAALLRLDALGSARRAVFHWDLFSMQDQLRAHLLQCLEIGEPARVARALAALASSVSHSGRRDAVVGQMLAEARGLAAWYRPGDGAVIELCAGIAAHNRGDFVAARTALQRSRSDPAARLSSASLTMTRAIWMHSALAYLGDLKGLADACEGDVAALRGVGDVAGELRLRASLAVLVDLADDAPERARRAIEAPERRASVGALEIERDHAYLAARIIDLYEDAGEWAWQRAQRGWPTYVRGYLSHGQYGRITGRYWRAATGLQAARAGARGRVALGLGALAAADSLAGEGRAWADALAGGLRAGALSLRGRAEAAATELAAAERGFRAAGMQLFAAAARWHRGRLLGADEGAALVDDAEAAMRARGVGAPGKMAGALIAGLP